MEIKKYMIRDITIGQFFPGESIIHRLDPRMKIILVNSLIVMLFIISSIPSMLFSLFLVMICYKIAKIPIKLIIRSIKPLLFVIILTAVINIFFIEGEVLFKFWKLSISKEGLLISIILIIRILNMVMISSLLTYTTSPIELTDALESMMSPLKRLKVPVNELSMMITISLRFVPTLIQEADKIVLAQKARGAKIDTGNIIQRVKSFIPVIIPLFVSAFRAADDLAIAMECRCYNGGKGKVSLKQLKFKKLDYLVFLFSMIILLLIISSDRFL